MERYCNFCGLPFPVKSIMRHTAQCPSASREEDSYDQAFIQNMHPSDDSSSSEDGSSHHEDNGRHSPPSKRQRTDGSTDSSPPPPPPLGSVSSEDPAATNNPDDDDDDDDEEEKVDDDDVSYNSILSHLLVAQDNEAYAAPPDDTEDDLTEHLDDAEDVSEVGVENQQVASDANEPTLPVEQLLEQPVAPPLHPNDAPPPQDPVTQPALEDEDPSSTLNQLMEAKRAKNPMPRMYKVGARLLLILSDAPIYKYDELLAFLKTVSPDEFSNVPNRKSMMQFLKKRYGLEGLQPKLKEVVLNESLPKPLTATVTTFSFVHGVSYLLGLIESAQPEDITIDPDDPFNSRCEFTADLELDELCTGRRFINAYKVCRNKYGKKAIPLPIPLELDKTHTDTTGKLTVEQLRYSIAWFSRSVLKQDESWIGLGMIPLAAAQPKAHLPTTKKGAAKSKDYHCFLDGILSGMKRVYECKGLKVKTLKLPKRLPDGTTVTMEHHEVTLVPYILLLNGDNEGADKVAGCYTHKMHSSQLCHICKVPTDHTSNPMLRYPPKLDQEIKEIVKDALLGDPEAIETLRKLSIHATKNAFSDNLEFLDVSGVGVFGILGPEVLHLIQKGIHEYTLEAFYGQKKEPKKKKNTKVPDPGKDPKKGLRRVIPEAKVKQVNALAFAVGSMLQRGSERDIPRMKFANGVTSDTHRSGSEMQGLVLHMLILLTSDCGKGIACLEEDNRSGWVKALEMILLLEEFMKTTTPIKVSDLILVRGLIKDVLVQFKKMIDRTKGMGMNFVKFHLPKHIVEYMLNFALCVNFSSADLETRHKFFAKLTSKTTQKRIDEFDFQVGCRQIDLLALAQCRKELAASLKEAINDIVIQANHPLPSVDGMMGELEGASDDASLNGVFEGKDGVAYGENSYQLTRSAGLVKVTKNGRQIPIQWSNQDLQLQQRIEEFLKKQLFQNLLKDDVQSVEIFTEVRSKENKKMYRANAMYKQGKNNKPWFDWACVKWETTPEDATEQANDDTSTYPCHLRLFFKVAPDTLAKQEHIDEFVKVNGDGMYAVVETLDQADHELRISHEDCWLLSQGSKTMDDQETPCLFIVPVADLNGCMAAFPHPLSMNSNLEVTFSNNTFFFLMSRKLWAGQFIEMAKERIKDPRRLAREKIVVWVKWFVRKRRKKALLKALLRPLVKKWLVKKGLRSEDQMRETEAASITINNGSNPTTDGPATGSTTNPMTDTPATGSTTEAGRDNMREEEEEEAEDYEEGGLGSYEMPNEEESEED